MLNRLTGSYLSIVAKCRAAAVLRQIIEPTSKYAAIGTAAHDYYETGIEQHDTFLEVPRFQRPEERTWSEVMHEWRFGWNFITGEFIAVPKGNGGRDYGDYPADQWVMASCDAAWIDGGVLVIEDLKTGAPQDPLCEQIVFIAYCAANALKHEGPISIQLLNATRYGYKTNPKLAGAVSLRKQVMDRAELKTHFMSMIWGPVTDSVLLAEQDIVSQMDAASPGKHCFFCRSKAYCDKYREKAAPKGLEYLDKLKTAQEAARDEQSERDESCRQGNHGPDTTGHNGGGAGEREAPGVDEAQQAAR